MLLFKPKDHSYHSIDPTDHIDWLSVTTLVGLFKEPFDPAAQALKSSKNPKSKWYRMSPDLIRSIWDKEAKRSTGLGNWYHDGEEKALLSAPMGSPEFLLPGEEFKLLPVIAPQYTISGFKKAPDQKLTPGIYPEHLVYLKSSGICGQSDRVEVDYSNFVNITDYKTNKEIKTKAYVNWEGKRSVMMGPLAHLDDCHLMHYAMQLSTYMYCILRQNRSLKPGQMKIRHVHFETLPELDEYGFPVSRLDSTGSPIIKSIDSIPVPYLQNEVKSMLVYLEDNRDKLTKSKK